MTIFGGPDALKMVRNTAALECERARQRAAARLARPMSAAAVPLLAVGGVVEGMALTGRGGPAGHGAGLLLITGALGLVLAGAARRIAYLKSHPSDV